MTVQSSARNTSVVPLRVAADEGANDGGLMEQPLDIHRVDPLIGAIYDGPLESPPWSSALRLIRDELQAAHVTLMLRPPSSENSGVMINSGAVSVQQTENYETHFFAMDPFVRLEEGQVVTAEEVVGKQWLESEIYKEFFKAIDVRHVLGADIYTKEGIECRFRVTRAHGTRAFTTGDKDLCRLLLPHLKRSIRLHVQLDLLECERQLFAGTVNRMSLGMVNFSHSGAVLEVNQEAKRILAEKDGIWLTGNNLCLEISQERRELQQMIRAAQAGTTSGTPGVVEGLSVTRPSGRSKLGVLVRAIPFGRWSESKQRPAVTVFIRDPESNVAPPSTELLRRLFGLTRMEAALAMLLMEGLTLDEAAEKMDVRRNTARTHLRSIFCKTGVTRQTMLVRLLLNSVLTLG